MKFIKHKSKQNRPVLLHERLSYAEIIALSVYSAGNSMEQGNIISIQPEMTLVEARSIISNSLKVGKRKARIA